MSDLEECPHGMGNPQWCAECKITNAPIVYTTGGGTRYHSTGKCPALIEGQKKGQRKPIKKKETVEVKPGIVSRFSNWVFIRAKSFSFSKSNEEKEKVGKVKGKIKKRINEVLKDLTLLKNKGCCLYFNNLHQIEDFTDDKITIISGEAEIRIPINLSVKDAEFMMAKHKMVKLLIPEFDVSKKEIEKIIQELCDDHILFTKKMKDPKSGRMHPFVGWSRFD